MKKRKWKNVDRMWSRVVSILLIVVLALNDCLAGGSLVWASQTEQMTSSSETEEELMTEEEVIDDFLADDEPQTVLISKEDITGRGSNVKYFINEDHSRTAALYPEPVHYEENGEWKEINNQLADAGNEDGTEYLGNQQNPLNVKFAKKTNSKKIVKIKMEDFQISWGLKDAQSVEVRQKDENAVRSSEKKIHRDEEPDDLPQEEPATLFTENPEAANKQDIGIQEAEKQFGAVLNAKPENNTTEGILPEEQEKWQGTNDPEEETLGSGYYEAIKKVNQEKIKVKNITSGVVYEEIFPQVDLEYILDSQKVKENIILKSPEAQHEYIFQFQIHGLNPVQEDNRILFRDGEEKTIFEIQPPFVYDAAGEYSQKVSMELIPGKGKKCEIKLTIDEEWMRDENRAFPVVLDPVIETSQDSNAIQDVHVLSGYPTSNYFSYPVLKTGINGSAGVARSFIKFQLPELRSGDMVVDARLNLYCYTDSTSSVTMGVYDVEDPNWTSKSVTWRTQPIHSAQMSDYKVFVPKAGTPVDFDITRLAKRWYTDGECSGVMIRPTKESGQYVEYVASDCATEVMECRPSVLITYLNNNGLEDYWSYHNQEVGRAGTGYVNDYNGNLTFLHNTASTGGNRMPTALAHVYNLNDKESNLGYGYGWRLNYQQTIQSKKILNVDYYEYVDEDGTAHYFYYDKEKQIWKDESGIDLELTVNSGSAEPYVVKDKQDNKLTFNSAGKLCKIADQNGNTLTITYTGDKISGITDGAGRVTACSYNTGGLLSQVKEPSGKIKTFSYQNNFLTEIKDSDGKIIRYTYDQSKKLMISVQNIDGYTINYEYSERAPYRIQRVSEKSGSTEGQSFEVWHYDNQSCFKDWKGRKENYLFNNSGNTISIRDGKGRAQMSKYLTEGSNKNKLSKVSKLQTSSVNLLNHSYLDTMDGWSKTQTNATVTLHRDRAIAREGENTFHMVSTVQNGKGGCSYNTKLEAGKSYTFSAYVKAEASVLEQEKCEMKISAVTSSGKTLTSEKPDYYITEDGWYRLMTTIRIPAGTNLKSSQLYVGITGKADVYVDCLQLEESVTAGRYNLIQNGDFRNLEQGFTKTGTNIYDRAELLDTEWNGLDVTYKRGVVNGSIVNMRSGPGSSYGVVAQAVKGTYVTAVGEAKAADGVTWYYTYVISDKQVYSGYMISQYIDFSDGSVARATKAMTDASSLNVRIGPGTSYGPVAGITRDQLVYVLGGEMSSTEQPWSLIYFESSGKKYVGYVLGEYLYDEAFETRCEPLVGTTLDDTVFHMVGNPAAVKKLTQTVQISGKAGDVFAGNLWGCGDSVVLKDNRTFGLEVEFVAADGTKEAYTSNFKGKVREWQFLNDLFIPKKDYEKINVSCTYNYNGNMVLFDGLAFFREDFSESFTYDDKGNVVSVQDNAKKKSSFEYDSNDNLKKLTDPKGNSFQYTYDTSHNVTEAVSAENIKYTFKYDKYGNPTESKIVNQGNTGEYITSGAGYTSDGNHLSYVQDPLGNKVSYQYDTTKDLLKNTTDGKGGVTSYEYDGMDRLTKTKKNVTQGTTPAASQVEYTYENDNLKQIVHNGYSYTFQKDGFGNSTGVLAAGKQLVRQTYEERNGNLASEQYGNGDTRIYQYDDMDRLTEIRLKDASGTEKVLYRYEYDKEGNLTAEYDIREDIGQDTIVTRYFYDLSGRLAYTRNDRDEYYRFTYDLNDNLVKSEQKNQYRKLQTEYTYDKDSRETGTKTAKKTYSTVYDPLGRIKSVTWNTAAPYATTYSYQAGANGSQSVQVQKVTQGGKATSYKYDKNGNITEITEPSGTIRYAYDELNQLIREDHAVLNKTVTYTYDLGGNLKERKEYPYSPDKTDAGLAGMQANKTDSYGYDAQWKDLLVSYNGQTITYDGIGNPLSYRGMKFSWKNGKELSGVTKNGQTITYRYNKDGIRNRKSVADGTVIYQLQGSTIVGEQKLGTSGGSPLYELEFLYDSSGNILSMLYNGTEYYYVKNLQGDITGIIDGQGSTVVTYQYDSWGKLIAIGGNKELGEVNPFRYRGYYYDSETGLYYLSSRYYDAEICQFLNADDLSVLTATPMTLTDKNLYAYCDNNPIIRKDTNGEFWETALDVISLGGSIVDVVVDPADPWAWASLIGDTVDLIPFITGAGELTKAVKISVKATNNSSDVVKIARKLYNSSDTTNGIRKFTGSYHITYKSGYVYNGKGGFYRATRSATRNAKKYKDTVTSITWKTAFNDKEAFLDEYLLQKNVGGLLKQGYKTYNKIWSPGKKLYIIKNR